MKHRVEINILFTKMVSRPVLRQGPRWCCFWYKKENTK